MSKALNVLRMVVGCGRESTGSVSKYLVKRKCMESTILHTSESKGCFPNSLSLIWSYFGLRLDCN